jgi:putative ABC transport system substrate-binding protein
MFGMRRREFITLLGGAAAAWPLAARAQRTPKVPRMGFLSAGSPPANPAFWKGMQELGYIEGQNILVEYRWAEGVPERLPGLVAELVQLNLDVIFAFGTQATLAAKNVSATPIVFYTHADPVEAGFVNSLARPGANFSGFTLIAPQLVGKRLELLKELVPTAASVTVLVNTANPGMQSTLGLLQTAARSVGVKLQIVEARTPREIESSFVAIARGGTGALYVGLDPLFLEQRNRIVEFAAKHRLPASYDVRPFVDSGGLMSYGPSLPNSFVRCAYFVDRILKGSKPSDLPVEQPTHFELIINLRSARALGLDVPPMLIARADAVIE